MAEITLFHGTNTNAVSRIMEEGLDPARSAYDWTTLHKLDRDLREMELPTDASRKLNRSMTVIMALGKGWTSKVSFFDDFGLARAWSLCHPYGSEIADEQANLYRTLIDSISNPYRLGDPEQETILLQVAREIYEETYGINPTTIPKQKLLQLFEGSKQNLLGTRWLNIATRKLDTIIAAVEGSSPAVLTVKIDESVLEKGNIAYMVEEGVQHDSIKGYQQSSPSSRRMAIAEEEAKKLGYFIIPPFERNHGLERAPQEIKERILRNAFKGVRKSVERYTITTIPPECITDYTVVGPARTLQP